MDYSRPDSSIHGILQARILEWIAMPSPPGDLLDPGIKFFTAEPSGLKGVKWGVHRKPTENTVG